MLEQDLEYRSHFLFTLDWLLSLQKRYTGAFAVGLVHIAFRQPQALGDAFGARDATRMLIEVAEMLRKSLRKTDLVMRDGASFWVLVPYSAPECLADKVAQIVEAAARNGLDIVDRDISLAQVPEANAGDDHCASAEELLSRLKRGFAA